MSADLSTSFGEAATQYTFFRPQYPPSVFKFFTDHLTGARDTAIELGAGSGQATKQLSALFRQVIAVEPDKRLAEDGDFAGNVTLQIATAEDADVEAKSADAVIIATAFHWMDQPLICKHVTAWLRPGGVFFPFAYDVFRFDGDAQEFFTEEFEKWRPFRDKRLDANYDYADILTQSRLFNAIHALNDKMTCNLSARDAAGLICTTSFASAYARAHWGPEKYFAHIHKNLTAFGDQVSLTFPIVGALGVVD